MTDMTDQPAGWYRERSLPHLHRYWDGQHWIGPGGETLDVWARVPTERPVPDPVPC